jgi:anti-sigma regulatory factor (Ser/Thr protein kinase)
VSTRVAQRLVLEAEPSSVRDARAFVRGVLGSWGREDLVDDATLMVSELATNVVLHARTRYAVVLQRLRHGLLCDVLDHAPAMPSVRDHDLSAATGRGLPLVAGLATSWGPTPEGALDGYTKGVRFELG